MHNEEVSKQITDYIRERFLDGDLQGELDERTPLLEWGILNSLNIAQLLVFIREELGVMVPPLGINAGNFKDIQILSTYVCSLPDRT